MLHFNIESKFIYNSPFYEKPNIIKKFDQTVSNTDSIIGYIFEFKNLAIKPSQENCYESIDNLEEINSQGDSL